SVPDAPRLAPIRREVRERLTVRPVAHGAADVRFETADVAVFASAGVSPSPGLLLQAIAAGAVPVAARLPVYEELLGDGDYGLLFEPGDADTLAAQLERLARDPGLVGTLRRAADSIRPRLDWGRAADEFEAVYGELASRRHA